MFRSARGLVLLGIGANTIGIAGVYFTNTFMIAYTTQYVGVTRSMILDCLFVVAVIQLLSQPCAAWLAEKIGGARFLKLAALLAMASPYPMFVLVQQGSTVSMVIGIALAVICMASFYSVIAGFISGIFPTHIRYSAISLAYQVCGAIAGGLTRRWSAPGSRIATAASGGRWRCSIPASRRSRCFASWRSTRDAKHARTRPTRLPRMAEARLAPSRRATRFAVDNAQENEWTGK